MASIQLATALGVELPAIQVLDVGAMMEHEDRYQLLVDQGLAEVTGFEPNPEKLRELLEARRDPYRYLPYFLGRGEPATFYFTRYPGCSSLYPPDPDVIDLFTGVGTGPGEKFEVIESSRVETRRLDDLDEVPTPDFVKIDVQGAALDVLHGGRERVSEALVLEVEAEFVPLYKGQPLFGDIQLFLGSRGFVLHKFIDVAGRAIAPFSNNPNPMEPVSQILYADAIFVREFTRLAGFSDSDLLKAATILHELYRSVDLVNHLLREHDRRRNTHFARDYLEAVESSGGVASMVLNIRPPG